MSELLDNKIVTDKNIFILDPVNFQEIEILNGKYKCKLHSISVNKHFNPLWVNKVEKLNWIITFKLVNCNIKQLIFYIGYNNEVKNKQSVTNDKSCELTYSKTKTKNYERK